MRRALSVVTPWGWVVVGLVLVGVLLVAGAGWTEGAVLAVMGTVCLAVALLGLLGRGTYVVEVDLPHGRARVGETAFGELSVTNVGSRRARAGLVELPVGQGVRPVAVPALAPGERFTETFGVPAARRGVIALGPVRSVRRDALGLVSAAHNFNERVDLYVHPRTIRVPFDATGFHNDMEGVVTSRLSSSDVSFHALRDYAPGDDPRHIHWPTSARTGRLSVRHYEETRRSHHLVVLDTDADAWPLDTFELGVSVAASMALAGLRLNRRVDVATSGGRVASRTPLVLLDALTELERTPSGPFDPVVRAAVGHHASLSALTVVCGPATSDDQVRGWVNVAGVDVATGIIRVDPGSPSSRRRLGGALLIDCQALTELPRLVAPQGVR